MNSSNYQIEFKKLLNRDYSSPKLRPIRKKAFEQFLERDLSTKKWDHLRFTNLSALNKNAFRISEASDAPPKNFKFPDMLNKEKFKIVFYNGHYQENLTTLPESIKISNNQDYYDNNNYHIPQPSHSPFDFLNTAFMDSGISISIKKNITIKSPIILIFISSSKDQLMISPRLNINIDKSSSVSLLEHHLGSAPSNFSNSSLIVSLKENSSLKHARLQMDSDQAINAGNIHIEQDQNSKYHFSHFGIGSSFGSISLFSNLNGQGAECHLNGLALTNSYQHTDTQILINHNSSHCTSSQNFKTILKDNSTGVFNGKVIVNKNAQKTDSSQSNKNILLSKKAKMNSNPQLVINADDVKCSHGSSTGELDLDALFYLRSRGINEKNAKSILIRGFTSEIFDQIDNIRFKEIIEKSFDKWMNNVD